MSFPGWMINHPRTLAILPDVPKYRDIADDIRNRISTGDFPVGGRLPNLRELRREYDAAEHTVRNALKILKEEGLLRISQGLPMVVLRAPDMGRVTVLAKLEQVRDDIDWAIRMLRESDLAP